ncbi:SLAP domain-containing protein, partial [Lactobacillus intestinalis]
KSTKSEKTSTKSESKKSDSKSEKKSTKSDSKKSDEKSTSSKKSTKKTIKVTNIVAKRKAQVYDKNGKKAKTYMGSKKWTIIGKGVQVKGLGTKTIDGVKYYALQPNHYYVKASDFTIKK